jgi:hypothetical protein
MSASTLIAFFSASCDIFLLLFNISDLFIKVPWSIEGQICGGLFTCSHVAFVVVSRIHIPNETAWVL